MGTIALILGTYAITLVLTQSEGPYGYLAKLRQTKAVDNFGLLNCFLCTAFWVAFILGIMAGATWGHLFIAWGGATIIDKVVK